MNIYLYNPGSHMLHIRGCCKDAPMREVEGYRYFKSENDAIAYAGRQICMCLACEKKRDEFIQKELLKLQKKEQENHKKG